MSTPQNPARPILIGDDEVSILMAIDTALRQHILDDTLE